MINSIVTNVVPSNVPSARKGIAFYGQPEATKPQPKAEPPKVELGDKFTKQTQQK